MAKKIDNETASVQGVEMAKEAKQQVVEPKKDKKVVNNKQNSKKKKEHKPSKLGKKIKETTSELKKVNWPSFGSVVKKTGVVLTVVLIFAVILFGIDRLLTWLFDLLLNSVA